MNTRLAIGMGSNLSDRLQNLKTAGVKLCKEFLTHARCSSVYESPPWGYKNQSNFLNTVLVGEAHGSPPEIVSYLKNIEEDLGRIPTVRYGPRNIDLDLLVFGEEIWETEGLIVPQSKLEEREFVLFPLRELWPEWRHPVLNRTIAELCEDYEKIQHVTAKVVAPPLQDIKNP